MFGLALLFVYVNLRTLPLDMGCLFHLHKAFVFCLLTEFIYSKL